MNAVDVGRFVAEQRKKKALTQKELAARLGVTDKAVSNWETGRCYPDIETIEKLSAIFEVGIHEILSGRRLEPEKQIEEAEKNVVSVMKASRKKLKKWQTLALVFGTVSALVLAFAVFLCATHKTNEHQILTSTQASFDVEKNLRISIPEIGLQDVSVRQVEEGVLLAEGRAGTVYLLSDSRYGAQTKVADYYLAVSLDGRVFAKDLLAWEGSACLGGKVYCADLDGDGDQEILVQETIGMSGGAGQYLSRVFDVENSEIVEVFSSIQNQELYDTGFSLTIQKGNVFTVRNDLAGYEKTAALSHREEEYYQSVWYDKSGEPRQVDWRLDSFYQFEPCDVDYDGVYEIKCCQYTWLGSHTDFIGTAVSYLKYNKETAAFVVCDARFEAEQLG